MKSGSFRVYLQSIFTEGILLQVKTPVLRLPGALPHPLKLHEHTVLIAEKTRSTRILIVERNPKIPIPIVEKRWKNQLSCCTLEVVLKTRGLIVLPESISFIPSHIIYHVPADDQQIGESPGPKAQVAFW
jgi:hypothetical protein